MIQDKLLFVKPNRAGGLQCPHCSESPSLTTRPNIPTICSTTFEQLPKDHKSIVHALLFGPPTGSAATIIIFLIGIFTAVWLLALLSNWITKKIWKGKARMQDALKEYESLITGALSRLLSISEAVSAARPAPDKWSKKEILGHLIDSASNNHQRFVRAQLSGEIRLPGYDQEAWVRAQVYHGESWENLVQLWKYYNLHLLHVAAAIPEDRLNSLCFIGENEPVTLEFLFGDYVRHVRHHLQQIFA